MDYPDGKKVMVGDQLKLWAGCHGTVVCSMDDDEYTPEYPRDDWAYLKTGVMIITGATGLMHYTAPEDSFELIRRREEL